MKALIALFALSFFSLPAFAGTKKDDIKELIVVTGSADLAMQIIDNMIPQFQQMVPNVPEKFWKDFRGQVNKNELTDLVVPIYEKQLTHEEIKALLKFYKSPVGKKIVVKLPIIAQESMMAGQKWGEAIGMKMQQKLKKDGYI